MHGRSDEKYARVLISKRIRSIGLNTLFPVSDCDYRILKYADGSMKSEKTQASHINSSTIK